MVETLADYVGGEKVSRYEVRSRDLYNWIKKGNPEEIPSWGYAKPSRPVQARRRRFHEQHCARYERVKELQQQGWSINVIRKHLGGSYWQVQRFFSADAYPAMSRGRYRSVVDGFVAYLHQRWSEGCQTARQLYREVRTQGYRGSMEQAASCGLRELENFAKVLRRDEVAVRAALSSPWSNGQVEGQINRLKMLKRQMYGRASFDLLRARVLYAA